jgi:hypothetical protein
MKYTVAMSVLAALAILVVGAGEVQTRRAAQHTLMLRTTVSMLSLQQLAVDLRECDPPRWPGEHLNRDTAFCTEVTRALDAQPLQAVEIRREPWPMVESWEFNHPGEWAKQRRFRVPPTPSSNILAK